jgi:3,2-trans-enoyl-CoA isomerase
MLARTSLVARSGARLVRGLTASRSASTISIEKHDQYAVLQLANAPVNMLSMEMIDEMTEAIETLSADQDCLGLIVTSGLPKIFSAGLDLNELHEPEEARFKVECYQ